MPAFVIKGPDGAEYEINAPEGASEQEVISFAQKQFGDRRKKAALPQNLREEELRQADPTGSGMENFAAGVGKAMFDTARGAGQLLGLVSREDVEESRARDAPLMDTGAGLAGDITGNVAMALAPGGILKGAATAARAAGASRAAPALSAAGGALLAPKTIKGAAAVGAGMGLAQPSTSTEETLANVALGTGASAAIPAVVRGGRVANAALEPLYEKGQERILGRLYNRAAGTGSAAARTNLAKASELVPGSRPTAGQAAENAGIAALERTATAIEPSATVEHAARLASQNEARKAALEMISGEPGKRAFFEADRKAVAQKLYDAAYEKGIDISRHPETGQFLTANEIAGRQGEITKLLKRPAIQESIKDARTLAANEGVNLENVEGSVKGLDYVARSLADKISKAEGNEQRILIGLRNRLLTTIDTMSPDYKTARKLFKDMSRPINQMDIGAEIADKSINKLTGQLQPAAFARSLSDDTARRATGFEGATLENTLEPEQLAKLTAVKEDLARAFQAMNAGRGPGSDTVQKLSYSNFIDAAGVPTWLRASMPGQVSGNIAGRAADILYGSANKEMAAKLARAGLEPQDVARMMQLAAKPGNEKLLERIAGGGSAIGRTAALSLLNAQQQ